MENKYKTLIAAAAIVYLLAFMWVTNLDLVDGTTHLRPVKALLEGKQPEFEKFYDYPIYYYTTYAFLKITELNNINYAKILSLILYTIFTITLYKTLKKEQQSWEIPLLLTTSSFWVIIFFTVNYIEPLIATMAIVYTYTLIKAIESEKIKPWAYITMGAITIALAFTKLTGALYAPAYGLITIAALAIKIKNGLKLPAIAAIIIIGVIVIASSAAHTDRIKGIMNNIVETKPINEYIESAKSLWLTFFMYPPNECQNQQLFGPLESTTKIAFMLITLPIITCFIIGLITIAQTREAKWVLIAIMCLIGLGQLIMGLTVAIKWHLPRYAMPVIALFYMITAKGLNRIKKARIKKIAKTAMIIYIIYSLAFAGVYAYHFKKVNDSYKPGEDYIKTLPEETRICGQGWMRGTYIEGIIPAKCTKEDKPDYIWTGCYSERISKKQMDQYIEEGKIEETYNDGCARIYKVKDQGIFKTEEEQTKTGKSWGTDETTTAEAKTQQAKQENQAQAFSCH